MRGLGIPKLTEICGVLFKYNGGGVAARNDVKVMAIRIPGLGLYSSLFTLWAAGAGAPLSS